MAPTLSLHKLAKVWAVIGYLVLSVRGLAGEDVTGRSSSQERFQCCPAGLLKSTSCGALGRGSGGGLGRGLQSRAYLLILISFLKFFLIEV